MSAGRLSLAEMKTSMHTTSEHSLPTWTAWQWKDPRRLRSAPGAACGLPESLGPGCAQLAFHGLHPVSAEPTQPEPPAPHRALGRTSEYSSYTFLSELDSLEPLIPSLHPEEFIAQPSRLVCSLKGTLSQRPPRFNCVLDGHRQMCVDGAPLKRGTELD